MTVGENEIKERKINIDKLQRFFKADPCSKILHDCLVDLDGACWKIQILWYQNQISMQRHFNLSVSMFQEIVKNWENFLWRAAKKPIHLRKFFFFVFFFLHFRWIGIDQWVAFIIPAIPCNIMTFSRFT